MIQEESLPQRFLDADQESQQILIPISGYEKYPLVSLKESIQPIKSLLYNCDTMIEVALRNSRQPKDALYKLPSYKGTVWRGVKGNLSDQYNEEHFWWGFSSCTETISRIETFIGNNQTKTIFNIECSYGKFIQSHSYYRRENEILLLPGTYFQIVDKMKVSNDLFIIHLREKMPPFQTITSPFHDSSSEIASITSSVTVNNATNNLADQTDLVISHNSSKHEEFNNNNLNQTISISKSNANNFMQMKTNNSSNIFKKFFFSHNLVS
ncbi:unnamed protein product [Adineta ricciae]|uniref:NAD(P)(+)--arginine ADP-ribosyltransferase n=1 Tax=Adineta ricciae TaxID=249248 RepID=A0A815PBA6_ADIRI|nr:unnamed protein product [Adineta ricciae]